MKELTDIQRRYYKWLLKMTLKNHNFPTRHEAAQRFGVNLNTVQLHVSALERKGHIKRVPFSPKYKFVNVTLVIK